MQGIGHADRLSSHFKKLSFQRSKENKVKGSVAKLGTAQQRVLEKGGRVSMHARHSAAKAA